MPRWLWFAPLALITVLLGLWAFRLGWIMVTLAETDVINRYAQKYLAEQADDSSAPRATLTDCVAYPGEAEGIWIVVRCGPASSGETQAYEYHVNRFGGLEFGGQVERRNADPEYDTGAPKT